MVFENVPEHQIKRVESQVRQMLDMQMELNGLTP